MIPKPEIIAMTGTGRAKQVLLKFFDGSYKLFIGTILGGSISYGMKPLDEESARRFFEKSETKLVSELS